MRRSRSLPILGAIGALGLVLGSTLTATVAVAEPLEYPTISVAGNFTARSEICEGDWAPDCAGAALDYNEDYDLYIGEFTGVPAGNYQYKITNGTWDVAWGSQGSTGGSNIRFTADGTNPLYVVFNPDNGRSFAANTGAVYTVAGSFQNEVGCSDDWQPSCLGTALFPVQNSDGSATGDYDYSTQAIPGGSWEFKVVRGLAWGQEWGDNGNNVNFATQANELAVFTFNIVEQIPRVEVENPPLAGVGQSRALWLDRDTVAWPTALSGMSAQYSLNDYPDVKITPAALTDEQKDLDWRARAGYIGLHLSNEDDSALSLELIEEILQGPIVIKSEEDGVPKAETGAQIAGVLDDIYAGAADVDLGLTWNDGVPTLRVWAPTATEVSLWYWLEDGSAAQEPALRDEFGVWTVIGEPTWKNASYLWDVNVWVNSENEVVSNLVTDPYSVGLTMNSLRSVMVDLDDPTWMPDGWALSSVEPLRNQSEQTIYELHVRDFSAWDATVSDELKGSYLAFTEQGTDGVKALQELADAGLTTVHLLPTFDIATSTINEDRSQQLLPEIDGFTLLSENQTALEGIAGYGPDSALQQEAVNQVRNQDAFNWGYDPMHWMTPEGSYATETNQDGGARTLEYREMVAALHDMGLRVVQDVVFNHTAASGQSDMSVLDRIVPGYYQRLNAFGAVETSTCCSNVATENTMAEKIMIDALVTQATTYKIDGFRFDLMGHHSLQNMINVRNALDALTVAEDGVDGKEIYLYGEGWDFGEVAGNALFQQATQTNIAGSDIGAFNDRLRDAVRGGGPFDEDQRTEQGFGTGLYVDPNARALETHTEDQLLSNLLHSEELIKVGLAGSLKDYLVPTADGSLVPAQDIDYNGAPAGYTASPQESITYVEAHDNETLFDNSIWKMTTDSAMDARLRLQVLSNSTVLLGQSPAFLASGTELLRSKSLDRDSYNSGDWFNSIVWDGSWNQFGKGLPIKEKNGDKWADMAPLLANEANLPGEADMTQTKGMVLDLLRLRSSSPLFTLGDADLIKQKVSFPNSAETNTPGVIVMAIDDLVGAEVDPDLSSIVVVFNSLTEEWTDEVEGFSGRDLTLSPIQAEGSDEVVKAATWNSGTAKVPARTVAVFFEGVADEGGNGGDGSQSGDGGETGGSQSGDGGETGGSQSGDGNQSGGGVTTPPELPTTGANVFGAALLAVLALIGGTLAVRHRSRNA
ncbi:pullulanase-type alpha-1,6-glucosidase [Actinomyces minihominis]|uniref:pullulanase-type alpha-1,6-glucosidase n=1 Tax=Actinomyces minihominis TaxID=2002838 RepID=UPI000C07DD94|nr:pullulanase-type alpha-1,6-glucosidase [Actinomyces minihominis]